MSLLLVSCAGAPAAAQAGEPVFHVTTGNPEDQAIISYQDGTAQVDIHSPGGLGFADFELEAGRLPSEMILRLHLRGLEDVRLSSETDRVMASVSSSAASQIDQHILGSGTESPLRPGHSLWMKVEIVSEQAEPLVPLNQGYFQIRVPHEFLRRAGGVFRVEWIDFYR